MKMIKHSLAIMFALLVSMPAWANDDGPKAVIETTVKQIIKVLDARTDKNTLTEADRDAIRQVIKGRFDYRDMARRSLGKPWRDLNEAEQTHFTDVYRELLERSYGNRLAEYKDQTVAFEDAELEEKRKGVVATVKSRVIDGNREIPVDYSMHQTESGWQVYEITIEGTGMVKTKYLEYKSLLKKDGYDPLLKALEDQLAKLKARDAG